MRMHVTPNADRFVHNTNTVKVNHSPSLKTDTPLDVRIKGGVVRAAKMVAGVDIVVSVRA